MKAITIGRVVSEQISGGIFEGGTVDIKTLIDKPEGAEEMRVAIVTFSQGARTKMHAHSHEQILYVLDGRGIIADEREEYVATPLEQSSLYPQVKNIGMEPQKTVASHTSLSSIKKQKPRTNNPAQIRSIRPD